MATQRAAGRGSSRRYTEVEKAQAVRSVRALRAESGTDHGAVRRVADRLGFGVESARKWVARADIDGGAAAGVTTADRARIRESGQEVRELRRANAILESVPLDSTGQRNARLEHEEVGDGEAGKAGDVRRGSGGEPARHRGGFHGRAVVGDDHRRRGLADRLVGEVYEEGPAQWRLGGIDGAGHGPSVASPERWRARRAWSVRRGTPTGSANLDTVHPASLRIISRSLKQGDTPLPSSRPATTRAPHRERPSVPHTRPPTGPPAESQHPLDTIPR